MVSTPQQKARTDAVARLGLAPNYMRMTQAELETMWLTMVAGWTKFNWDAKVVGEGWGLYNTDTPLSCGIERNHEDGVFEEDTDAVVYVNNQAAAGSPWHMGAFVIHMVSNELRRRAHGHQDRRLPPTMPPTGEYPELSPEFLDKVQELADPGGVRRATLRPLGKPGW